MYDYTPKALYVKPTDGYWITNFRYLDYPKAFLNDPYDGWISGIKDEICEYAKNSSFIKYVGYEIYEFDEEDSPIFFITLMKNT